MFALKLWFIRGLENYPVGFESTEPHVGAGQGWKQSEDRNRDTCVAWGGGLGRVEDDPVQLPPLSLANGHSHPTAVPYLGSRPCTQPVPTWMQSVRTEASQPQCSGRPRALHSRQPLSSPPQSGPGLLSCSLHQPW